MKGWQALDHKLTSILFRIGNQTKPFWIFWSQFGFLLLVALTILVCWQWNDLMILPFAADITVFAFFITVILQEILRRHRPTEELHGAYHALLLKWSFPSAHAATAFSWAATFVFGLWRLTLVIGPHHLFVMGGAILLAGLISISRVFLGVHHIFDVIAGALLGIVLSVILISL